MRNPFKPDTIQLGELHPVTSRFSDAHVNIHELYDLTVKYKRLYYDKRTELDALENKYREIRKSDNQILERRITILEDKNEFLEERISSLKQLSEEYCKPD